MSLQFIKMFSKDSHEIILDKTEKPEIDDSLDGYSHIWMCHCI